MGSLIIYLLYYDELNSKEKFNCIHKNSELELKKLVPIFHAQVSRAEEGTKAEK